MKYGNYLIVTLLDFRRHFDFTQFFKNKRQFVSDMHPDKVYYWGDGNLIKAYHTISNWILNDSGIANDNIPAEVLNALQTLTDRPISITGLKADEMILKEDVITLSPGQNVVFPLYENAEVPEEIDIHLHKIVMSGDSEMPSVVSAGNESRELHYGDVLFLTECEGKFIDFTPTFEENEFLTGQLIESPDQFGSLLVIADKKNGTKQTINGVVSFILVDNGYIYINERGALITIDNNVPMMLLRINELKAVQIKRKENSISVLYHNGICKSTTSMTPAQKVIKI